MILNGVVLRIPFQNNHGTHIITGYRNVVRPNASAVELRFIRARVASSSRMEVTRPQPLGMADGGGATGAWTDFNRWELHHSLPMEHAGRTQRSTVPAVAIERILGPRTTSVNALGGNGR